KRLCHDRDIWIDGLNVTSFIFVFITSPQFKMFSAEYGNIEHVEVEIAVMEDSIATTLELSLLHNHQGQFVYRRHKWAAKLSTVLIEVWRQERLDLRK
ncbi:hypothetical protein V1515DRAFT_541295, partial [Lipomyces mesembrius]